MKWGFVVSSVLVMATSAYAADTSLRARLWLGAGADSNADRQFVVNGAGSLGRVDALLAGVVNVDGRVKSSRLFLSGSLDLGARKYFITAPQTDTFVSSVSGAVEILAFSALSLGLDARLRDRRGNTRDYSDGYATAFVNLQPSAHLGFRLAGGAHGFLFYARHDVDFLGPSFFFETRVQPSRKHIFFGVLQYEPRFYFAQALDRDGAAKGVKRFDHSWFGTVGYRFRGPINLTFSYAAMLNRSSSFGESFVRHRLAGTAGFALPWKLTLLVQGAAQFSVFPDGVYTSEDMFLQSEDDNFNSASLKLLRALGEYFEIDLKYAFYYDRLARGNGWYMRQVATVGFAAHWQ